MFFLKHFKDIQYLSNGSFSLSLRFITDLYFDKLSALEIFLYFFNFLNISKKKPKFKCLKSKLRSLQIFLVIFYFGFTVDQLMFFLIRNLKYLKKIFNENYETDFFFLPYIISDFFCLKNQKVYVFLYGIRKIFQNKNKLNIVVLKFLQRIRKPNKNLDSTEILLLKFIPENLINRYFKKIWKKFNFAIQIFGPAVYLIRRSIFYSKQGLFLKFIELTRIFKKKNDPLTLLRYDFRNTIVKFFQKIFFDWSIYSFDYFIKKIKFKTKETTQIPNRYSDKFILIFKNFFKFNFTNRREFIFKKAIVYFFYLTYKSNVKIRTITIIYDLNFLFYYSSEILKSTVLGSKIWFFMKKIKLINLKKFPTLYKLFLEKFYFFLICKLKWRGEKILNFLIFSKYFLNFIKKKNLTKMKTKNFYKISCFRNNFYYFRPQKFIVYFFEKLRILGQKTTGFFSKILEKNFKFKKKKNKALFKNFNLKFPGFFYIFYSKIFMEILKKQRSLRKINKKCFFRALKLDLNRQHMTSQFFNLLKFSLSKKQKTSNSLVYENINEYIEKKIFVYSNSKPFLNFSQKICYFFFLINKPVFFLKTKNFFACILWEKRLKFIFPINCLFDIGLKLIGGQHYDFKNFYLGNFQKWLLLILIFKLEKEQKILLDIKGLNFFMKRILKFSVQKLFIKIQKKKSHFKKFFFRTHKMYKTI
jgi:hypothetical protein